MAVVVVVARVLPKHGCGVPLVDDQDVVEDFPADRADEAFGDRVGPRLTGYYELMGVWSCGLRWLATRRFGLVESTEFVVVASHCRCEGFDGGAEVTDFAGESGQGVCLAAAGAVFFDEGA